MSDRVNFSQITNNSYSSGAVSFECRVDAVNSVFQLFLIAVNAFHLVILKKLKQGNDTQALRILILMAINDISISSVTSLSSFCILQSIQRMNMCLFAVLESVWVMTGTMRYFILAVASYDRYVAICLPFRYVGDRFLNNKTVILLAIYLVILIINTPLKAIEMGCIQISDYGNVDKEMTKSLRTTFQSLWTAICLLVIVITVTCVLRELHNMKHREGTTHHDQAVIKATHLILATISVFVCCLLPPICTEIYFATIQDGDSRLRQRSRMVFDSYAFLNVIIYAAMSKPYQQEVTNYFRFSCKRTTSAENTDSTQEGNSTAIQNNSTDNKVGPKPSIIIVKEATSNDAQVHES